MSSISSRFLRASLLGSAVLIAQLGLISKTPEEGAATQVYVATNPDIKGVSGAFFEDCNAVNVSGDHHIFNKSMAERLWSVSEEMADGYLIGW